MRARPRIYCLNIEPWRWNSEKLISIWWNVTDSEEGWQKYSEICRWLGNIWNLPLFGFKPLWPSESDEGVISLDVGPLVRPSDQDHLDHMPQVYMIALFSIVLHSLCFPLHLCKDHSFKNRTRLMYNCAHLRSTEESLAIWVKNFVWVKNFLGENFFGWKIFLVKIFLVTFS